MVGGRAEFVAEGWEVEKREAEETVMARGAFGGDRGAITITSSSAPAWASVVVSSFTLSRDPRG
jgi:hypothetical protein